MARFSLVVLFEFMGAFNCLLFDGRLLAGLGGAVRPLDPLDVPLASRGVRHMGCLIIVISWSSPRFVDAGLDPFRKPAVARVARPRARSSASRLREKRTGPSSIARLHPGLCCILPLVAIEAGLCRIHETCA